MVTVVDRKPSNVWVCGLLLTPFDALVRNIIVIQFAHFKAMLTFYGSIVPNTWSSSQCINSKNQVTLLPKALPFTVNY